MRTDRADGRGRVGRICVMRLLHGSAFSVLLVVWASLLSGCSDADTTQIENEAAEVAVDDLRIVSFVPSATRIIVDLGLGHRIVGVAEHDAAAPEHNADGDAMPMVGNFMEIDTERLLTLSPTHVVFPKMGSGVPAGLQALADASGFAVLVEPYPSNIKEALAAVPRLAFVLGVDAAGDKVFESVRFEIQKRQDMQLAIEHIKQSFKGPKLAAVSTLSPRVLLAFSVDLVVASGPGSVNDELLGLLGAENAVADAAVSAVTLDREALIACSPDVIVLLLPGATEQEAAAKVAWFDGLPIPAVQRGKVSALTDPQVLLPSTNLPEVLEALGKAMNGTLNDAERVDDGEAR